MNPPPIKHAAEHLQSLRDGRSVYLDGQPVGDVTVHPAFRNSVAMAARLYDYQADPAHAGEDDVLLGGEVGDHPVLGRGQYIQALLAGAGAAVGNDHLYISAHVVGRVEGVGAGRWVVGPGDGDDADGGER